MTLERIKPPIENAEIADPAPQPDSGVLISLQNRIAERRMSDKEREMIAGYVEFCESTIGMDPRRAQPEDSEAVAEATHTFLSQAVGRRIERLKTAEEDEAPKIYAIPTDPVKRHIGSYYRQFGFDRRAKPEALQEKEDAYLSHGKRPIFVVNYSGGGLDSEGVEIPIKEQYPRIISFPELGLALRLHELLTKLGHQTAADSAEVVVAAYGAWFPERIRAAASHSMIIRLQEGYDSHNIKHWREDEIPEEARAEKPRRRRTQRPSSDDGHTLY